MNDSRNFQFSAQIARSKRKLFYSWPGKLIHISMPKAFSEMIRITVRPTLFNTLLLFVASQNAIPRKVACTASNSAGIFCRLQVEI